MKKLILLLVIAFSLKAEVKAQAYNLHFDTSRNELFIWVDTFYMSQTDKRQTSRLGIVYPNQIPYYLRDSLGYITGQGYLNIQSLIIQLTAIQDSIFSLLINKQITDAKGNIIIYPSGE